MKAKYINTYISFLLLTVLCLFVACKDDASTKEETKTVAPTKSRIKIPKFNADTAYALIEKQLSFGTRVPGSEGHTAQRKWMVQYLKDRGAEVTEQNFKVSFLTVENVTATNIIASFNPKKKKRFILAAHWDTRLIAEKDPDEAMREKPIMGADDGASGVAVLMEIANIIQQNPLDVGIDLIFFDAEDNGTPGGDQLSWCLGSQYWGKNLHKKGYTAEGGILLDLVGAKDNRYGLDSESTKYAPNLQKKVWELARGMGNTDLFQNYRVDVIDDHIFVNAYAKIPMIDIIGTPQAGNNKVFGPHHHTHEDDIDVISKKTLKKTGQVVTAVIYKFSEGSFVF